jgi:hypothetical protein
MVAVYAFRNLSSSVAIENVAAQRPLQTGGVIGRQPTKRRNPVGITRHSARASAFSNDRHANILKLRDFIWWQQSAVRRDGTDSVTQNGHEDGAAGCDRC